MTMSVDSWSVNSAIGVILCYCHLSTKIAHFQNRLVSVKPWLLLEQGQSQVFIFYIHVYGDFSIHAYGDFSIHVYGDFSIHVYLYFYIHVYLDFYIHVMETFTFTYMETFTSMYMETFTSMYMKTFTSTYMGSICGCVRTCMYLDA